MRTRSRSIVIHKDMTVICEGGYIASSYLLMTRQFTYQSLYAANKKERQQRIIAATVKAPRCKKKEIKSLSDEDKKKKRHPATLMQKNCSQPNITKQFLWPIVCCLCRTRCAQTHNHSDINLVRHIPMCKWRSRAIVRVPNSRKMKKKHTSQQPRITCSQYRTQQRLRYTEEIKAMILNQREKLSCQNVHTKARQTSHSK